MEIPDDFIEYEIEHLIVERENRIRSKEWERVIGIEAKLGEIQFLLLHIEGVEPKARELLKTYREAF